MAIANSTSKKRGIVSIFAKTISDTTFHHHQWPHPVPTLKEVQKFNARVDEPSVKIVGHSSNSDRLFRVSIVGKGELPVYTLYASKLIELSDEELRELLAALLSKNDIQIWYIKDDLSNDCVECIRKLARLTLMQTLTITRWKAPQWDA